MAEPKGTQGFTVNTNKNLCLVIIVNHWSIRLSLEYGKINGEVWKRRTHSGTMNWKGFRETKYETCIATFF